MQRRLRLFSLLLVTVFVSALLVGCSLDREAQPPRWLVLVTTRELEVSGLLDALIPPYEQATGVRVKRLSLTTAKALEYAGLAGVDLLLLPAGPAFDKLAGTAQPFPPYQSRPFPTPTAFAEPAPEPAPQPLGYLFNERQLALWSELVILAPAADPLNLKQLSDAASVLKVIATSNARFYLPQAATEPGLYQSAQRLWSLKGLWDPKDRGSGYRELAADTATVIRQAAREEAYTLAPLAEFLAFQKNNPSSGLQIGFSSDLALFMPYEIALPNNTTTQDRNVTLARTLAVYLKNQQAQTAIGTFTSFSFIQPPYRPFYYPVYVPASN